MTPEQNSRFMNRIELLTSFCFCLATVANAGQAELPRAFEPNDSTGSSAAVIVRDCPLVHTAQVLPATDRGDIATGGAVAQVQALFDRLDSVLVQAGSAFDRIIKLNVYVVRRDILTEVQREMAKRFPGEHKPAVTFVVTRLPHSEALVAADAVATTSLDPERGVQFFSDPAVPFHATASTVVPRGTRIYVAGQAERGDSLLEATRKTLEQLQTVLRYLGRDLGAIAQLKAFLTPMTDARDVEREIAAFFKNQHVPPIVLVEWRSAATAPIEIELIAWGGLNNTGDVVQYLTPPGMTASPVFSRVARVNHSSSIFVSGVSGSFIESRADGSLEPIDAEHEVKDAFKSLQRILQSTGSDFKHLAKATYYVANDAVSQKLNELRPNYYDPSRPPSASKAMVVGVGPGQLMTMDMIAVPAWTDANPEYGPPEYGHGLSAEDASRGWISLFDGTTTFGWIGSKVENGALWGGKTTASFGNCELRGRFDHGGTLTIAGHNIQVANGEFTLNATQARDAAIGPVELGDGVLVRQLVVRPLGVRPIFNGRDMTGWKRIDHVGIAENRRPTWQVEDGSLRARGGPGCVEFVGASNDAQAVGGALFGDMIMQLDVRTRVRHANGGVFFRAIPGDFMNGYEAQVFNRSEGGDPNRPARWCTGGIDDRQNARRMVSRDGHFFKMTIIASQAHIATWINGYQQTDWTDDRPRHANPRQGLRIEPGVLQLQAHDPDTDVEFKNIVVSN
jgi:enamine deaminase RidA (YjgF/YER057c/UK114 family)